MEHITEWHHELSCEDFERLVWRKAVGVDGETVYEMYVILHDTEYDWWWSGGGTFKLSHYDEDDHKHALREFGRLGEDVDDDELARYLIVCNLANYDTVEQSYTFDEALGCMNDLVRTSPWDRD